MVRRGLAGLCIVPASAPVRHEGWARRGALLPVVHEAGKPVSGRVFVDTSGGQRRVDGSVAISDRLWLA